MIKKLNAYLLIKILIAFVWLINGLVCKVFNLVPRHQEIVASILGPGQASLLTKLIGVSEILMAGWIISGYFTRINVVMQVLIIATMNLLEFFLVPELLLYGRANILFAAFLIFIILVNEYWLKTAVQK